MIPSERASQEEQNGTNFSFVYIIIAPSSEEICMGAEDETMDYSSSFAARNLRKNGSNLMQAT